MISQFRVRNYKALRDVTLDLTPVHVLIGPNDSGKTSMMEALAALCRSVELPVREAFLGSWEGADLVWQKNPDLDV
ncbi:MAG TPA: AAA family ATPase [Phycisphaerae bacterium]|nr:AAA family ATPase [Phycisphaerae bacterium]